MIPLLAPWWSPLSRDLPGISCQPGSTSKLLGSLQGLWMAVALFGPGLWGCGRQPNPMAAGGVCHLDDIQMLIDGMGGFEGWVGVGKGGGFVYCLINVVVPV